jgi:glycine/D-amino acid oxidase-like deaminating enzyme
MTKLPDHAHYVIIGAGIHGLSTAMHLAQGLKARGKSVGAEGARIVVLDKAGIGAGASGIACGVVRTTLHQPAMRELMAHGVGLGRDRAATIRSATCRSARSDARAGRHDLRQQGDRTSPSSSKAKPSRCAT